MSRAISSKKNTAPTGCLILFLGIFAIVGAVAFATDLVWPLINTWRARSWTATTCTIQSSAVASRGSGDDLRFYPDILYVYSFNGQAYTSTQLSAFQMARESSGEVQSLVNTFPTGAQAQCFVNPLEPSQAVLDRTIPSKTAMGLMPLIFVAAGVGGIFWQAKAVRAVKRNEARNSASWQPKPAFLYARNHSPHASTSGLPVHTTGEVVLKPNATRAGSCLGIAIFSLIWNGFVGFFLWHLVFQTTGMGFARIFPMLFMIPFALVGIVMLFVALSSFVSLFNSRIVLIMSTPQATPGGSFDLNWRLQKSFFNPHQLSLTLEAREEATYTRGTDTCTDKSVFYTHEFFQASSFEAMKNGRQTITIPGGAMHSFAAPHNKIIWTVKVNGSVRFGVAIKEDYEIFVMPSPRANSAQSTPGGGRA